MVFQSLLNFRRGVVHDGAAKLPRAMRCVLVWPRDNVQAPVHGHICICLYIYMHIRLCAYTHNVDTYIPYSKFAGRGGEETAGAIRMTCGSQTRKKKTHAERKKEVSKKERTNERTIERKTNMIHQREFEL